LFFLIAGVPCEKMRRMRGLIGLSLFCSFLFFGYSGGLSAQTGNRLGVGAEPPEGALWLFDGQFSTFQQQWTYWEGPGFYGGNPVRWPFLKNPEGADWVMSSNDPAASGGRYGRADLVTREVFRDFRLHVEFYLAEGGGNSGVYLQNRYEIQILDGDSTRHGMAAIINEIAAPYHPYRGLKTWNAYDIMFKAARFSGGRRMEPARITMYFNGVKVHENQPIQQVWGGSFSGIDGGNDGGRGITDTPGGLKLQAEGHSVLYRNIWIQRLNLDDRDTHF